MKRFLLFIVFINFPILLTTQIGAETSLSDFYKIGSNDVLEIRVQDNENLRTMTTVTSDGTISFPYIGTVVVRGLTLSEIEKIITKKLSEGYIKYPVVTVSLMKALSNKFFSYGEVSRRGEISLEEKITVVQALSMAGGVTNDGRYGVLKVKRKQDKDRGVYKDLAEAVLNDGILENSRVAEIPLKPDDILIVERNRTFLIQGEVSNRGRFILEKDMTVLKGLLQAGGVSSEGLYGRLKVRRKQEGEIGGYKDIGETNVNEGVMESQEVENTLLKPDDILIVERNKTFFIYGEINKTGEFVLKTDMTIFKALTIAGGFTKWGSENRVKILRLREDNTGFETIKVNINHVISGDANADILLNPNDVVIVSTGIF